MIKTITRYYQQSIKINYTTPCSVKDKKHAVNPLSLERFSVVRRDVIYCV